MTVRPLAPLDRDAVLHLNLESVHHLAPMDADEYQWFLDHARCAWAAIFSPVGTTLLHGIIGVEGTKALLRGFVEWRGTRYPVAMLRAASRYQFPWES